MLLTKGAKGLRHASEKSLSPSCCWREARMRCCASSLSPAPLAGPCENRMSEGVAAMARRHCIEVRNASPIAHVVANLV